MFSDLSSFENTVDSDHWLHQKPSDQDPQFSMHADNWNVEG